MSDKNTTVITATQAQLLAIQFWYDLIMPEIHQAIKAGWLDCSVQLPWTTEWKITRRSLPAYVGAELASLGFNVVRESGDSVRISW